MARLRRVRGHPVEQSERHIMFQQTHGDAVKNHVAGQRMACKQARSSARSAPISKWRAANEYLLLVLAEPLWPSMVDTWSTMPLFRLRAKAAARIWFAVTNTFAT